MSQEMRGLEKKLSNFHHRATVAVSGLYDLLQRISQHDGAMACLNTLR